MGSTPCILSHTESSSLTCSEDNGSFVVETCPDSAVWLVGTFILPCSNRWDHEAFNESCPFYREFLNLRIALRIPKFAIEVKVRAVLGTVPLCFADWLSL